MTEKQLERFWNNISKTDTCWLWIGYKMNKGYGFFSMDNRPYLSHRISYQIHKGDIPKELELDHLCRIRHCVNPDHLEAVAHSENMARGKHATKIYCIRGHEFTGKNTINRKGNNGRNQRECRQCKNIRAKKYRQNSKRSQKTPR